ncbi:MAG: DUF4331 family protein [Halioglobus sp.]
MKVILCLVILSLVSVVRASDHLDSSYMDVHPMWDIGDFFLWTGAQTGSPVFLMTFNPLTNQIASTRDLQLDEHALYQFKIDTDGDYKADIAYKISIIGSGPEQGVILRKATGADAETNESEDGLHTQTVAIGKSSVAGGPVKVIKGRNEELFFVGPRQDPFFFDFRSVESPAALDLRFALSGDNLPSDGSAANTFGPTNMTVIAVEIPELKGKAFSAWGTSAYKGEQVDRCGRASITAIFTPNSPPGRNLNSYPWRNKYMDPGVKPPMDPKDPPQDVPKQIYNATKPVNDVANYRKMFQYRLEQVQTDEKEVERLLGVFLPDVLGYDPSRTMGYPNGRDLVEDAVYWTIAAINPFLAYDEDKYQFPAENPQKLSTNFPYAASPVFFPPHWKQPVEVQQGR